MNIWRPSHFKQETGHFEEAWHPEIHVYIVYLSLHLVCEALDSYSMSWSPWVFLKFSTVNIESTWKYLWMLLLFQVSEEHIISSAEECQPPYYEYIEENEYLFNR